MTRDRATVEPCPLCRGVDAKPFAESGGRSYLACPDCDLRFVPRAFRITFASERARYELHNNDVLDVKYQAFVSPLVCAVEEFTAAVLRGLDFGCGRGPVVSHLLTQKGYDMTLYDPFFHREERALQSSYDFAVCCEVVEHFREPAAEFGLLRRLVRPGGCVFVMTALWAGGIRFQDWHYQRDPTHVSFYSARTFEWIRDGFGFRDAAFRGDRVVVLR